MKKYKFVILILLLILCGALTGLEYGHKMKERKNVVPLQESETQNGDPDLSTESLSQEEGTELSLLPQDAVRTASPGEEQAAEQQELIEEQETEMLQEDLSQDGIYSFLQGPVSYSSGYS